MALVLVLPPGPVLLPVELWCLKRQRAGERGAADVVDVLALASTADQAGLAGDSVGLIPSTE